MRFLLLLLLSGCAYQPEVEFMLGRADSSSHLEPTNATTAMVRIRQRFETNTVFCPRPTIELMHISHPSVGRPFNDKYDEQINQFSAGCAWGGKRR